MSLHTESFVQGLIDCGISHLCVVPCSFVKDVINEAINNPLIEYLPCASEAIACSVAAGLKMAGKQPVVIIQSSGLTNMGSCITSLLKPYNIKFPILTSWRTYAAGDSEIQHEHLATALPELIRAYGYDHEVLDNDNLKEALRQIRDLFDYRKIGIIRKNTFTKVELLPEHCLDLTGFLPRSHFLECMNKMLAYSSTLIIGTTGNTAREIYSYMPSTNNFYMAGNMGGALALGLGAAKAGKQVIVCGGDAEFVMHMGGLTTAGRYAQSTNLVYILFDNESNKSTGGQNTYQRHVNYIEIGRSSGLGAHPHIIYQLDEFIDILQKFLRVGGVSFMHVKCSTDLETPRPPLNEVRKNKF